MASLDKSSVRQLFDQIKTDFEKQIVLGKVSSELVTLFRSLLMLFELLLCVFMERKTQKTPLNSGIPPSQTQKDDSAVPVRFSKSVLSENRVHVERARNTRTVESVTVIDVSACKCCGEDLSHFEPIRLERRTRVDLVFEKVVEHMEAEQKCCPVCQATTKGIFPAAFSGPLQYGFGVKAYAIELLVSQMIPLARVSELLAALLGNRLSESTLLGYLMDAYDRLERWVMEAQSQLLTLPCLHSDETGIRVDQKGYWMHVYSGGEITLKFLHKKRGIKAIEAIGILPKYPGVVVHDCWSSYLTYDHCQHGLCGSHLLRELAFILEAHGYRWARQMKRLLSRACHWVSTTENKCMDVFRYERLKTCYQKILQYAALELPPLPDKPKGKRGKVAKSDAHNLMERLEKYQDSVLRFALNPHVAFTNNRAERDLRMSKVKQKISGGFRTEQYANAYCRISSYLQTSKYQGINSLSAISRILDTDSS